jgi:transposase
MKFKNFVGIDVSKEKLDICFLKNGVESRSYQVKNMVKDITKLFKELKKDGFENENTLYCLEHTGIYNNILLNYFFKNGCSVWLESAAHIKLSMGLTRGKNDKVDAKRIANYAYRNRDFAKLWEPKRPIIEKLKCLLKTRARLSKVQVQLKGSLNDSKRFIDKDVYKMILQAQKATINQVKKTLKEIEIKIIQLIEQDGQLMNMYKLVKSVDGIGPVIAATVVVKTNEFRDFKDPKKFACQSGVAPFEHSSGSSIKGKTRVSHRADKSLKTLFHLAALSAINGKNDMKEYYQRKITQGKNKMVVINAIRNKLIERIFAVVKRGTPYVKNYQNSFA